MFWEMYQTGRIGQAQHQADSASRDARRAERIAASSKNELMELKVRHETMALTCQAMWELLAERLDVTEAELLQRIEEVDLRDGVRDGKMSSGVQTCPECDRPVNARRQQCLYCGVDMPPRQEVFNS